jgi:hypothetical protein
LCGAPRSGGSPILTNLPVVPGQRPSGTPRAQSQSAWSAGPRRLPCGCGSTGVCMVHVIRNTLRPVARSRGRHGEGVRDAPDRFIPFLASTPQVRKLLYTTDEIGKGAISSASSWRPGRGAASEPPELDRRFRPARRVGVRAGAGPCCCRRWVQTCRRESEFETFYNRPRPHQVIVNARPLQPLPLPINEPDQIVHRNVRRNQRPGGMLNEYDNAA